MFGTETSKATEDFLNLSGPEDDYNDDEGNLEESFVFYTKDEKFKKQLEFHVVFKDNNKYKVLVLADKNISYDKLKEKIAKEFKKFDIFKGIAKLKVTSLFKRTLGIKEVIDFTKPINQQIMNNDTVFCDLTSDTIWINLRMKLFNDHKACSVVTFLMKTNKRLKIKDLFLSIMKIGFKLFYQKMMKSKNLCNYILDNVTFVFKESLKNNIFSNKYSFKNEKDIQNFNILKEYDVNNIFDFSSYIHINIYFASIENIMLKKLKTIASKNNLAHYNKKWYKFYQVPTINELSLNQKFTNEYRYIMSEVNKLVKYDQTFKNGKKFQNYFFLYDIPYTFKDNEIEKDKYNTVDLNLNDLDMDPVEYMYNKFSNKSKGNPFTTVKGESITKNRKNSNDLNMNLLSKSKIKSFKGNDICFLEDNNQEINKKRNSFDNKVKDLVNYHEIIGNNLILMCCKINKDWDEEEKNIKIEQSLGSGTMEMKINYNLSLNDPESSARDDSIININTNSNNNNNIKSDICLDLKTKRMLKNENSHMDLVGDFIKYYKNNKLLNHLFKKYTILIRGEEIKKSVSLPIKDFNENIDDEKNSSSSRTKKQSVELYKAYLEKKETRKFRKHSKIFVGIITFLLILTLILIITLYKTDDDVNQK